jgi:hypothetical protein
MSERASKNAIDERLAALVASLAASWCGPENDPDSDIFLFRAEGFVLTVAYVEHGMDDGADGYGWTITRETSGFINSRSRGCHVDWVPAVFDAWETLAESIRNFITGEKFEHTLERNSKTRHMLIDAFGVLALKQTGAPMQ